MFCEWKFIKNFPSSHIHKWKTFGPGLFWCITIIIIFFLSYSMFACAMYWFFVITLFSTSVSLFKWTESVDSVGTTIFTVTEVLSSFFFIGANSMFACFQMYVKSTFFLFFFSTFI